MHWNKKFLSLGSEFISVGKTSKSFPLVVGRSGVPYLLYDRQGDGHQVKGELWRIDADCLEGLDQYEGITKGHYSRHTVIVEDGCRQVSAQVYAMHDSPKICQAVPFLEEYTPGVHHEKYRAVAHILFKQQLYLQGCCLYNCRDLRHPKRRIEDDFAHDSE